MKSKVILFFILSSVGNLFSLNAQVNLQTGAAEYSIPLYSYSNPGNGLATQIRLVYTAGNGLKVNEMPSCVGAGWQLDFGGFIQRIQHGEPDDQKNNDTYTYPSGWGDFHSGQDELAFQNWVDEYYPNGYLYSEYSPSQTIDNGGGYSPLTPSSVFGFNLHPIYLADMEQDVFMFKFNGRVGYFVIGKKDQNNNYPIRTIVDSKLKIEKIDGDLNNTSNIRTTISEFRIIDENGYKYTFKDAELTQVCSYNQENYYKANGEADPNLVDQGFHFIVNKGNPIEQFVKNRWNLTEIENTLTGEKISFEYDNVPFDFQGNLIVSRAIVSQEGSYGFQKERNKGTFKRIKRIVLSSKETVDFNYFTQQRVDFPSDKALQGIDIKYDNQTVYSWNFELGYFVKNQVKNFSYSYTAEDIVWSRLCLLKLTRNGNANSSGAHPDEYKFDYYLGNEDGKNSAVPPLFSYYQDAWGYYNVSTRFYYYSPANQTSLPSNPPYEPFGGNLLPLDIYLKKVTDPQGALSINYWAPSIPNEGILKSVENSLGGKLSYTYEPHYFAFGSGGSNLLGTGGVRVKELTEYDGISSENNIVSEYKYIKVDGSTSGWGSEPHVLQRTTTIIANSSCTSPAYAPDNTPIYASSGIRIDVGSMVTNYLGINSAIPAMIMQTVINGLFNAIVDIFSSNWNTYSLVESNSLGFTSSNLLPFQYSRVEVINKKANDNIGKTVFEFTSPADQTQYPEFQIDFVNQSSPYSGKQRYAYWLYGLPKIITVFDKNSHPVKKVENEYQPFKNFLTDLKFQSQKWLPNTRRYYCWWSYTTSLTNEIDNDTYYPICGRVELRSSKEHIYNANGEYAVTITGYEYSTDNYLPKKIKTTNSKGEEIETNTYYVSDYSLTGAVQTMKDKNMLNIPVSSQTFITKGGNQKYLLSGSVSEFGIISTGDIKPIITRSTRLVDPVVSSSVAFNPSQLVPNTMYYKETGNIIYNSVGLPVQVNSDKGRASTVYDYDNKMAVATVVNADYTDIAYTSFEADGLNSGWAYDATKVYEEFCPTGKKCIKSMQFDGGLTISRSISSTKKYILSFWLKGELPVMTGATFALKRSYANASTGYTYYEYEVTNGSTLSIKGKTGGKLDAVYYVFNLDELRLYPAEARMSTVAYDPLLGKTSECDENGRIVYYEYDGLSRLKLVRDQYLNVIKIYEYNYKQ